MNPSKSRARGWLALAGAVVVALGGGPTLVGGDEAPLRVDGWTVDGEVVWVSVQNVTEETRSGIVFIRALLEDANEEARSPVTVPGGGHVVIPVGFPAPVATIVDAGVIVDEGSPF